MSSANGVDTSTVDNYHVIELVGEGSFGKARVSCTCRDKSKGASACVKHRACSCSIARVWLA